MLSDPQILRRLYELKLNGLNRAISPGLKLARGMADLGFEEFCSLSRNKVVSLLTGTITTLNDAELNHLFWVPDADEMALEVLKRGAHFNQLMNPEGRCWTAKITLSDHSELELTARTLEGVMLDALTAVIMGAGFLSRSCAPTSSKLITRMVSNS